MSLGSWTRKTSCLVTLFNTSSKIWKLTLSEGSIINEILLEIFQTFNACIASPLAHSSLPHRHLFRHYFKSKENVFWDQNNWKHLKLDENSDKMLSIRLEYGAWCLGFCQVNMAH